MLQTTSFYAPPSAFQGEWVTLPSDEAHHAANVLRGGAGEEVVVVDGEGGWYQIRLEEVRKSRVVGKVVNRRKDVGESPYDLTIGIGLLKNRRRFETFLEKAVELGVRRIIPFVSKRTEKEKLRRDRAERVMVAALKQTQRSRLPHLEERQVLEEVIGAGPNGLGLICHEEVDQSLTLRGAVSEPVTGQIHVLVGPEGGFADQEVAAAADAGWQPVSLGPRRLRAETAGIAVAAGIQFLGS